MAEILNHKDVHFNSEVIQLRKWKNNTDYPSETKAYFSDGVHPSKLTYKIWGEEVAKFITNNNIILQ